MDPDIRSIKSKAKKKSDPTLVRNPSKNIDTKPRSLSLSFVPVETPHTSLETSPPSRRLSLSRSLSRSDKGDEREGNEEWRLRSTSTGGRL